MEEHGEWVEMLWMAGTKHINISDIMKAASLTYAEGFGRYCMVKVCERVIVNESVNECESECE